MIAECSTSTLDSPETGADLHRCRSAAVNVMIVFITAGTVRTRYIAQASCSSTTSSQNRSALARLPASLLAVALFTLALMVVA